MIWVCVLLFKPVFVWDRLAQAQRGIGFILATYLLPFIIGVTAWEGYGLLHWGHAQSHLHLVRVFTVSRVILRFEILHALLLLGAVFFSALLLKLTCEQFHTKKSYRQTFTVMAYAFGPTLLVSLLDVLPHLHPLVTWAIGSVLSLMALYSGVPRVIQMLPVHALGTYLAASFVLLAMSGIVRLFTAMFVMGQIDFERSTLTRCLGQWLGVLPP